MGGMRRVPADAWIGLVLLAVCGVLLNDLLATEGSGAFVKTTTLPTALVIVIGLLSVVLLGRALWHAAGTRPAAPGAGVDPAAAREARAGLLRVGAMVLGIVAYILALPWLGYFAATALFLAGANLLFGNRRPVSLIAVALLVPLALLLFFERFMLVLLPSSRLLG